MARKKGSKDKKKRTIQSPISRGQIGAINQGSREIRGWLNLARKFSS